MRRLAWILPHLFRPSLKDTITRLLRVQDGVYATWSGLLLQEPGGRSNCNRPLCNWRLPGWRNVRGLTIAFG